VKIVVQDISQSAVRGRILWSSVDTNDGVDVEYSLQLVCRSWLLDWQIAVFESRLC